MFEPPVHGSPAPPSGRMPPIQGFVVAGGPVGGAAPEQGAGAEMERAGVDKFGSGELNMMKLLLLLMIKVELLLLLN